MQQCGISCSSFLYFIEIQSHETTINSTKFFLHIFFVNFREVWIFAPTLSSACVSGRYHKIRNIVTSNPPCFCGHSNVESTISRYISRAQCVVHKYPDCVHFLLVGRRSERLCRRLVLVTLSHNIGSETTRVVDILGYYLEYV